MLTLSSFLFFYPSLSCVSMRSSLFPYTTLFRSFYTISGCLIDQLPCSLTFLNDLSRFTKVSPKAVHKVFCFLGGIYSCIIRKLHKLMNDFSLFSDLYWIVLLHVTMHMCLSILIF